MTHDDGAAGANMLKFLDKWVDGSRLQTFEDRERFRDEANAFRSALREPHHIQIRHLSGKESAMDDLQYLDLIKNPPVGGRFHWRDQWFFQRTKLGAVLVTLPDRSQKVIPPNEWASIVASVSLAGETGDTWRAALDLHGGTRVNDGHEQNCPALIIDGDYRLAIDETKCRCRKRVKARAALREPPPQEEVTFSDRTVCDGPSPPAAPSGANHIWTAKEKV